MRLGIFARTFSRPNVENVLDAVRRHGLDCIQFNFACAGLPSMPERIEPALLDRICAAANARKISIAAVSGTFNMIHPDVAKRREGVQQLAVLASACKCLSTSVITLCTGTRDPEDMWRGHPENQTPAAWKDLLASLSEALAIADQHNVTLAVEPEVSNVMNSAPKTRRLLDELKSDRLKVVIDPANLFHAGELPRMRQLLDETFDLLGPDIIMAHAKDLSRDGQAGHEAAGTGVLDYDYYLDLLQNIGFTGPLLLHGLSESQVESCVAFLRRKLEKARSPREP